MYPPGLKTHDVHYRRWVNLVKTRKVWLNAGEQPGSRQAKAADADLWLNVGEHSASRQEKAADPWLNVGEQPGLRQEEDADLWLEVAQVGEQPRSCSQTLQCCNEKSVLVHLHFLWSILLLALSCEWVRQTL